MIFPQMHPSAFYHEALTKNKADAGVMLLDFLNSRTLSQNKHFFPL
jgi:hypothetical protein